MSAHSQPVRALVLAAGLGERLRPLTEFLPKPLLPVAGRPVAAHTLRALRKVGCEAAALNLHHLGDLVRSALGDSYEGLPVTYSVEARLLGTLGPLFALRDFLAATPSVLLVNGDSLCRWPLAKLLAAHRRSAAIATLLVTGPPLPPGSRTGVGVDREGRVVALRDAEPVGEVVRRYTFAGAHVLDRELVACAPEGPGDIISGLYLPLLKEGARIQSVRTGRAWHDLGTPHRYLEAVLQCGNTGWLGSRKEDGASIERGARIRRSIVTAGAVVESGAEVRGSLLMAGSRVTARCRLRRVVLGPGAELVPGSRIENRLVTRALPGVPMRAQDSLVEQLVYSPLEGGGNSGVSRR